MFEDNSFVNNKICDLETKEFCVPTEVNLEERTLTKLKGMVFRLTTTTVQREGV